MLIKIEHFGAGFTDNEHAKLVFSGFRYHYVIIYL